MKIEKIVRELTRKNDFFFIITLNPDKKIVTNYTVNYITAFDHEVLIRKIPTYLKDFPEIKHNLFFFSLIGMSEFCATKVSIIDPKKPASDFDPHIFQEVKDESFTAIICDDKKQAIVSMNIPIEVTIASMFFCLLKFSTKENIDQTIKLLESNFPAHYHLIKNIKESILNTLTSNSN